MLATASAQSATIQTSHDALSRIARVDYDDGTSIAYTYDAAGNRLSLVVQAGIAPDRVAPLVQITQPTTERLYVTTANAVTLGGTASDVMGIASMHCTNGMGAPVSVAGTTSWTAGPMSLSAGANRIQITAADASGNIGSDSITIVVLSSDEPYVGKWTAPMNTFGTTVSATAPDGSVLLADHFSGSIVAGGQTLTSNGTEPDIYLAKLGTNGQPEWVRQIGGVFEEQIGSCVRHPSGGWVIGGEFRSNGVFGAYAMTALGSRDAFIARVDDNGNILWVRRGGGTKVDYGERVAVDGQGNCYLVGEFTTSATFSGGSTTLTAVGTRYDIFVVKYSANGDFLWARSAGGGDYDTVDAAVIDPSGNLYVSGRFTTNAMFGSFNLIVQGDPDSTDAYLVKYNSSGTVLWAKRFGEPAGQGFSSEAIDFLSASASGECFFGGYYDGPMLTEGFALPTNGTVNASFVGKINAAGSIEWLTASIPQRGLYSAESVVVSGCVLPDGSLIVAGDFMGIFALGSAIITNNTTASKLYFAKYNAQGNAMWGISAETAGNTVHYLGSSGAETVRCMARFNEAVTLPVLGTIEVQPNDTLLFELGPPDAASRDVDQDGMKDWEEVLAGSSLSDFSSMFEIGESGPTATTDEGFIIEWVSSTGVLYTVNRTTNINVPNSFIPIKMDIPGLQGVTKYGDTNMPASGPSFYKITVEY